MNEAIHDLATGEITIRELTPEETAEREQRLVDSAWHFLRAERNARLAECDWTVLADTPTTTAAWKVYRQQLRDLPDNTTDPFNPVWPTPPA